MGVKERSLFVPSQKGLAMQEMLKGCSTFSREKEFRNFLPFPLSPDPTKQRELFMTCAHGEPVSPDLMDLMHQAAVDVWMFLLIRSPIGSLKAVRSKARKAHSRRFLEQDQRHSMQPSGS